MGLLSWFDGSPDPKHFLLALYFSFSIVVARFVLDRFIFQKVAHWLAHKRNGSLWMDEANQATIGKCRESMWKLTYYTALEICVLKIIYHEPWFKNTLEYFKGWPAHELKLSLSLVYMCQCGFYIYSIAALLRWETRRKDFAVMMAHHIITVVLIGYSYLARFFQLGSIILALHDASDVFLEAAKVLKYSGKELGASIFFGLFAISWLLLRLLFFPFWVIKSSSCDLVHYLDLSKSYPRAVYYIFNMLLLTLLIFHIYWWVLICSMIMKQLRNKGKVGEDIRSDSEED